jgi:hypothetical protein
MAHDGRPGLDILDREPLAQETLRLLHARDRSPGVDPDFAARLLAELEREIATREGRPPGGETTRSPLLPHPGAGSFSADSRREERTASRIGRSAARGFAAQLATAALVVLVLAASIAALNAARPTRNPQSTLDPPPTANVEPRFAAILPAESVPVAGNLGFDVWRLALAPGLSNAPASAGPACCRGPQITHVLEGELTVEVDGAVQVARGLDLPTTEPPGEPIVLRAGDTVIHDFGTPAGYANHGASPVQLVAVGLHTGLLPAPWLKDADYLDGSKEGPLGPLPAGPLAVSLVRAEVPPNGELPAPPPGSLLLEVGAAGDASIGRNGDGSLFNISDTTETIYVVAIEPRGTAVLGP